MHNKTSSRLSALLPFALAAAVAGCAQQPAAPAPEVVAPEPVVAQEPAPIVLKPDYPERYVVQRGDTLWDISANFLKDPWRWPELWQNNPQVRNPHLIYPGDVLTLIYIDGRPVLQVQRGAARDQLPELRLSPKVRIETLEQAIPTIPLASILPFISRPQMVTEEELEMAPYIVSSADEHLMSGAGNRVYARGFNEPAANYTVIRRGRPYIDPDNDDELLGYEAIHVADAKMQRYGEPATLLLVASKREALNGDRLLPSGENGFDSSFNPRAPGQPITGKIISVVDGVTQIGQYQVVALNRGLRDGIETGHVLAVYTKGQPVRDPITGEDVVLPDERAGVLMVFRPFERMSYALVMSATRAMHVYDRVSNP
jgi:hypothetical protein